MVGSFRFEPESDQLTKGLDQHQEQPHHLDTILLHRIVTEPGKCQMRFYFQTKYISDQPHALELLIVCLSLHLNRRNTKLHFVCLLVSSCQPSDI